MAVSVLLKAQNARFQENQRHEKTGIGLALLAAMLVTCAGVQAQKPIVKTAPVTLTPDLSKLNIEKVLQQLQTTTVQPSSEETSPLQVVAQFLQLSPGQVGELEQLLQARLSLATEGASSRGHFEEHGARKIISRQEKGIKCRCQS